MRRKGFDALAGVASAHVDDNRPRHNRIGQPSEAREGDRCLGRDFLGYDGLAMYDASTRDCAFAMAGVQQSTYFLILFRLRPEYGVDLIKQDRRQAILASNLTKHVGGRNVHSHHRAGHE
jgi:hypothetical protein